MEDLQEQLEDFNELYKFATVIATKLGDRVTFAEKERDEVKAELKNIRHESDDLKIINKNISAELAKCQRELEIVKSDRDNLRGQNQKLSEENQKLHAKLNNLKKILEG